MESIRTTSSLKDGKTGSWEKTIRKDDITKCIRVEEVMNGYIISYNEYGRKNKSKNKPDGEYYDENKKWISKTNPLEVTDTKDKTTKKESTDGDIDAKFLAMIQGNTFNL